MTRDILEAFGRNAAKHEAAYGQPLPEWSVADDLRYLGCLVEETGELAAALVGKHEHPMELEILQIAGVLLNWLSARGTTGEQIHAAEAIDAVKHPMKGEAA